MRIFEFVERIWKAQFLRFAAVGTAAFVVDTAVLYTGLAVGLGFYWGRALSFVVAATFTWYGNRRVTFTQTHAHGAGAIAAEWARFLLANLVGGAVNYGTYAALVNLVPAVRAYPVLGVAAGSIAGLSVNFTLSKLLVFRDRRT